MKYATAAVLALFNTTVDVAVADLVFEVAGAPNYRTVWAGPHNAPVGAASVWLRAAGR